MIKLTAVAWLATIAMGHEEQAILKELADIRYKEFRADPYIRIAARCQSMGRDKASRMLLRFAKHPDPEMRFTGRDQDMQVIILCRMLFKARGQGEFRRPMIGGPHFLGEKRRAHYLCDQVIWPLEPIELVDGIPFYIVQSYSGVGIPEPVEEYVHYCLRGPAWNDVQFKPKTAQEKRQASTSSWPPRSGSASLMMRKRCGCRPRSSESVHFQPLFE